LTAVFLLEDQRVGEGTTVLGHAAAGSVGCFLGALLRRRRAHGIGLVSSDAKAEVARRAGWRDVVVYRREDPLARVRALTGGRGAGLVLDSVAGPDFARSVEMTATGGTLVLFGRAAGDPPAEAVLETFLLSGRNLGLRTYFLGTTLATRLDRLPGAWAELFALFREDAIHLPMERLPLAEAALAHERVERGETVGKVILVPGLS
ncbi:MAG: zinc-binding dehydrogenase, partial [Myxococcota bacterium]|nr:zinc-binding dehydrogenase [Myxococcota bacterium]